VPQGFRGFSERYLSRGAAEDGLYFVLDSLLIGAEADGAVVYLVVPVRLLGCHGGRSELLPAGFFGKFVFGTKSEEVHWMSLR
jgi:hypothetical protein